MDEVIEQSIMQCEKTIKELEANYGMFLAMGGKHMKSMNKILLNQIQNVKEEKIMYESIQKELHHTLSEQNLKAGLLTMH